MEQDSLIPHLFRTEYRKLVSVLCRRFGFDQLENAEDLASDTFLTAAQNWGIHGIPPNPTAWIYQVAMNKAKNYYKRRQHYRQNILPALSNLTDEEAAPEIDLSLQNINDSQLRMMFALCQSSIAPEARVGLMLRVLCGFGIDEIADAFLSNRETISKRLQRARDRLRQLQPPFEVPAPDQLHDKLNTVLTAIYLLFNEGYYSVGHNNSLRKELCFEAMRLVQLLLETPVTNTPAVNALMALMCFHASRFEARINDSGDPILYADQDTAKWNSDLIGKGGYFLQRAATGKQLSQYHLEAGIAYWHTRADLGNEKWRQVLELYDKLLDIAPSPAASLNRAFAYYKLYGAQATLDQLGHSALPQNQFYHSFLGELYASINQALALEHYQAAYALAKTDSDRQVLAKRMAALLPNRPA